MKKQSKFLELCVYECGCTHVMAHVSQSGDNFLESLLTKLLFLKDLPVSAADCIRSTDITDAHHPMNSRDQTLVTSCTTNIFTKPSSWL